MLVCLMFEPAASCSADRRLLIDFQYIGNFEVETRSVLSRIPLWNFSGDAFSPFVVY